MQQKITDFFSNAIETLEENKTKFTEDSKIQSVTITDAFFNTKYRHNEDITKCETHKDFFSKLHAIKTPVIYWLDIEPIENNAKNIREVYETYRNSVKGKYTAENYRYTSAYKTNMDPDSKTLYVGKVQTGFWGRIVTHLGYNKNKGTAGMQLSYWYKIKDFDKLTLNYIVFDNEMKYLVSTFEKNLALELKPLIGQY